MIQFRKSFFETNSSSVHALIIPKDQSITIPKHLYLVGGEYGWEEHAEDDTINYLYQACLDCGGPDGENMKRFIRFLENKGIEVEMHQRKPNTYGYYDGYVDHAGDIPFEDLFGNESLLERFLFGNASYVQTGNDNSDMEWAEELESDEFLKDNIVLWK